MAAAVNASAQTEPTQVNVLFGKIYVPGGFDSNDNVQLVAEGIFPNSCYKPAATKVSIDKQKKTIHLEPQAYKYGGMCLQVLLPYSREVDLGILETGTWTITQGPNQLHLGEIRIHAAISKDADDFIYAPISQAFFSQVDQTGEVTLMVELPCDCLSVSDIRVKIEPDVIVVQPILKLEEAPTGATGILPVKKTFSIGSVTPGRYLLHVRSMNGNAVNSLVEMGK
jgi:hypothetical protein